ncbi:MAG: tRNA lysidine(34) synthetase TilS [Armatimonadetes bacterium]|nr:tRNA lysidine(34) synthetase TilS [Armatimonadota bacterium]
MDLLSKVSSAITEHRLLSKGDTVIVAVSGGADSTALLHALATLRSEWNLTLVAVHLDHRLRADSPDDARFVARRAAQLGVESVIEAADVQMLARRRKLSLEEAGREARYALFARLAGERRAQRIATGHTLNDEIETVLMRMLRGDPWDALGGIPMTRPLGAAEVIRPLLSVTREQIRTDLSARSITWREDPSNRDLRFARNWIRLRVLPALERKDAGVRDLLVRFSRAARSADRLLTDLAHRFAAEAAEEGAHLIRLPLDEFRRHPPDLQRRMLRWAVARGTGTTAGLPVVLEERGLRVAAKGRAGEVADLRAVAVRVSYDALEVTVPQPPAPRGVYRLRIPGTVTAEAFNVTLTAEIVDPSAPVPSRSVDAHEVDLDAASVGRELQIRAWRPGDRMIPLGMRGKKKVQDLFVDDKVPRWDRHRIPVVTDGRGQILWIVGRRISEIARITDRTQRVVRLRARNTSNAAVVGLA